jgi:hypothetical protein
MRMASPAGVPVNVVRHRLLFRPRQRRMAQDSNEYAVRHCSEFDGSRIAIC